MSRIKIELLSNLCTGSGYSYAGIIDSDICFDEFGIPFIPARRIKGCMRESLENILYGKYSEDGLSERLFGKRGTNIEDGALRIGNANIQNYAEVREYLLRNGAGLGISSRGILERYTHIVGQTAMKDGVADDTTLRYTRVVNRFDPCTKGTLVFQAQISYDKADEQIVEDILKATRHIGMKRNRGMGNVRCSLAKEGSDTDITEGLIKETVLGDRTKLSFVLENKEPLVLGGEAESDTNDFISGKMLIGMMASKYLKAGGDAQSDEFKDLFLNGSTTYSHLYPYRNGKTYYPAPDYVNRLKKTKKYVYVLDAKLPDFKNDSQSEYNYEYGNQPKKLKGKYVSIRGNEIDVLEMKRDVIYHHRHEKDGRDEILYSVNCITPGQKFAGTVDVKNEDVAKIKELLKGECYFGRSRSAQYGLCTLTKNGNVSDSDEKVCLKAGDYLVVSFRSDVVIVLEDGRYSVYYDEIRERVASELGVTYEEEKESRYLSSIQTTVITGYMSKWNLRNEPVPGIKAGSYLVYKLTADYEGDVATVGVRTREGYGRVAFLDAKNCKYDSLTESMERPDDDAVETAGTYVGNLLAPIVVDEWMALVIGKATENKAFEKVSNAAIGRWKLMLTESLDMYDDPKDAFDEFKKRIESIKTDETRKQGEKLYKDTAEIFFMENDNVPKKKEDCVEKMRRIGIDDRRIIEMIRSRWSEYIYAVLANRKYTGGNK